MKKIPRFTTKIGGGSMKVATIVGHLGGACKGQFEEQDHWTQTPPESSEIRATIHARVDEVFSYLAHSRDKRPLDQIERHLRGLVFALARLFLAYFLCHRHENSEKAIQPWMRRGYRREEKPKPRVLNTFFGPVRFWRWHLRPARGTGIFPLDRALGLTADAFSLLVLQTAARLSTLVTFEQVTGFFVYFLSWSPSKTSVERSVLGFGRHTSEWFDAAPAPDDDGEILVIQIDSKGTPTATDEELEKRRGKRNGRQSAPSPRHRGRDKRKRRGPKKRRKKGDKSKNAKCATIVVMYTLKKSCDENGKPILLGPINKRVYASYAPKIHAFAIARREAKKRGFTERSGERIHILTDGDNDLERNVKDFFPKARHTIDIVHVLEYFWEAGRFQFKEGSEELASWVKKQEKLLYRGKAAVAILNLNKLEVRARDRKRFEEVRGYLSKRMSLMNYGELRKQDLDVSTGAVEGAVRHVIGKRFDSSGMRWIRERAEALLQLRCIEINGDWESFVAFASRRAIEASGEADVEGHARILTKTPAPLPTFGAAA